MLTPEQRAAGWLIYKAGRGWYRPNAQGYTMNPAEAGRYSHADALSHSHPNGPDGPRDGLSIKHESEVLGATLPTAPRRQTMTKTEALVEELRALHVWPQSIADHHADVLTSRQIEKLYEVGNVAHRAADEIERLAALTPPPVKPLGEDGELLPCPFCGGKAERFTIQERGDNFGGDVICCTRCQASSHVEFGRKENLVDRWNQRASLTHPAPADEAVERVALDVLAGLSSYLGAGIGDDTTTAQQYDDRIRWGIDHIGRVYRDRAAQVVEECSKRPGTTWGAVKRAILDDTCLPTAQPAALRGQEEG